jgi:hypothetical protein
VYFIHLQGNCNTSSYASPAIEDNDPQLKILDKRINQSMKDDQEQARFDIKLLLLGCGECGKSTILKQMKILHKNGFTSDEKKSQHELVYKNVLQSIQALCRACFDLEIGFGSNETWKLASDIANFDSLFPGPDTIELLSSLYNDVGIQKAYNRRNEYHLLDNAPYWLAQANIDRIFAPNYMPTDADILRTRQATSGVIETDFIIDGLHFRMYDVGQS